MRKRSKAELKPHTGKKVTDADITWPHPRPSPKGWEPGMSVPEEVFTPSPAPTNVVVERRKPVKFTPSPMSENIVPEKRKRPRFV